MHVHRFEPREVIVQRCEPTVRNQNDDQHQHFTQMPFRHLGSLSCEFDSNVPPQGFEALFGPRLGLTCTN